MPSPPRNFRQRFHAFFPSCLCYSVVLLLATAALPRTSFANARTEAATIQTKAPDELASRQQSAVSARTSGDPREVAKANALVLALALRRLGNIRLAQTVFAQAAELYRQSLTWEDAAETHVALAIATLYLDRPEQSIEEATKALLLDPNNSRAFNIQGKAFMKKRDYRRAAESLRKAMQLQPDFESAYALGVSLLSTDQPESKREASRVFDTIVQAVGDSGSLRVMFGRAYRDAEMQEESIRELRKAVALDPKTPHAHYFLGLSLLWKNEWTTTPEIRQQFVTELRNYPRDFLANYFLGYLDSNDRRYGEANLHLKNAAEIDPTWPEPWLFLGLNANVQGDVVAAEKYLRKCIELTGSDEARGSYQVRRAYLTLGRILLASGRAREAAPYLERAREDAKLALSEAQQSVARRAADQRSDSPAAVVAQLKIQEDQALPAKGSVEAAALVDASALARSGLSEERKATAERDEARLRTVLAASFSDLATSEAVRRDYSGALEHFREAERWNPGDQSILRSLGMAAFRAQNYAECVRALRSVVETNPDDAVARGTLGSAYFSTENYRDTARTIAPLGDRAKHDAALGYTWAYSLSQLGELDQATEVLSVYENTDLPIDSLMMVGQLWIDMADYARAVNTFRRIQQRDQGLARAHYFAGLALLRWNHDDDALAEFRSALILTPDDADTKVGLGYLYMLHGQAPEAAEMFRSAIASQPENGNAHYQLGKLLLDDGKVQEAVTHLEAAVRSMPDSDYVHFQLQAAYRKDSRPADADRELQIYRELKAKHREATTPRPLEKP